MGEKAEIFEKNKPKNVQNFFFNSLQNCTFLVVKTDQ